MKRTKKITQMIFSAFIISLALVSASCLKQAPTSGIIIGIEGTVTIMEKGGAKRPASVTDVVRKGDLISTGKRSQAIIEAGPDIVIKVLPESSINVIDLAEKGKSEISLKQGNVLSKIRKLVKGSDYRVVTPTSVASVHGTVFLVSCDSKGSMIAVGEGTVTVEQKAAGEKNDVVAGLSADVVDTIKVRPMSELELLRMEKIKIEEFITDAAQKGKGVLEGLRKDIKTKDAQIDQEIDEFLPMSLEVIRKRYGRVDEIKLFDGTVIRGLIKWRGAEYVMITPEGIKSIPGVKVKDTGLMQ